jgi:very-short-patch-repair endonuclease
MRTYLSLAADVQQLAQRQNGHVTRVQLLSAGMSGSGIQHLLHRGLLWRVHTGVYALGYRRWDPIAVAHAAVLACGEGAVLSHDSAAALYGLRRWPSVTEVITTVRRRRPGIHVHRSRTFTPEQANRQYGMPVTTADRTIADIAGRLTDPELIQLVGDARRSGRLGPQALARLQGRSTRTARLLDPAQPPSESLLMAAFLTFLRRHRLPLPLIEQPFHGFRVDAIYPAHRLIVELDGYEFHRDRDRFERGRRRDAVALEHGYETLRITWRRITEDGDELARQLRTILRARVA